MRIHRIVFFFFLLATLSANSQENKSFVSGYVYDYESKKVISNINISVAGTGFGGTTNKNGYFKFHLEKLPAVLFFSHVGYKIDSYTANINNHKNINVYLEAATQEIDEVIIIGERVQNLIEGDTLNVVDYEIWQDKIIMVANPIKLKTVNDKDGLVRYVPDPIFPDRPKKMVSAPIIYKADSIFIFDFFDDYIDVYNTSGEHINEIPIDFHLREIKQWILKPYFDIDQHNFKQKILYDKATGRAFALFRYKKNGRYSLKEIDLSTGMVKKIIEIPDYTWVEKINNNVVYFLYPEKIFPYNI